MGAVWRTEGNFRIQVLGAALALGVGLAVGAELVPLFLVCALVLALELVNSALESTLDLVSPEFHPLVKRAKDAAAGAVLVAALFAVLVGLWVLGPPLWRVVFG
ncbi:diacylglycerol kinase [Truepera radiovictrix DSM 17093]|uniref:Diacylglycerol kinase n=1 Tax=Truepera radiovictrix (strain DSM 17093 / CIP 108686 / LMG 22925 / RQ-24) TaxID=649638 RepID=D7CS47_TRURR|nr:diacylglycerol kinase [Truepera radiovictrix]ADI13579.1 diacylglycerol kinase [Truepera radiovictrix DSM 17093]WMT57858.1 diacylglycerol kinase [Truepera radiovictrix]